MKTVDWVNEVEAYNGATKVVGRQQNRKLYSKNKIHCTLVRFPRQKKRYVNDVPCSCIPFVFITQKVNNQ